MIGSYFEYVILVVNIGFMIYSMYLENKVLKNDPKGAEKLIKSKELFIYIEDSEVNSNG
jgi:hypothetical protein